MIFRARAARIGVQSYAHVDEYRPPEEVFDPRSLATWRGAPVLVGHREVDLDNVRELAVGAVLRAVRDDEHVLVDMRVWNDDAARAIARGELVELSAGYATDLEMTSGTFRGQRYGAIQRNIRVNHVALGPRGWARCGASCSILGT